MPINISLPKITASNPNEQMQQMQSYIYQLAEQLNWALSTIESSSGGNVSTNVKIGKSGGEEISQEEAENTFNSIKALIIKSADIVKAYEDTIFTDFNGKYFADSDFGTYLEETNRSVEENSKVVHNVYTKTETIEGKVDGIDTYVEETKAYIDIGELGEHKRLKKNVYGVAIGQTEDGVYKKYAWYTSDGVSLFDENGNEVAYISQNNLHITNAAFSETVQLGKTVLCGGYKIDATDGMAFTWIG